MGAWIEIFRKQALFAPLPVAPFVGAWIEIGIPATEFATDKVAPFVGAWIEIFQMMHSRA